MSTDAQPAVDPDAIRARLDNVYDPELDQSIVDLEYVDEIYVDDGSVTIEFVLPTAWCSPAFAWMMATGIRDEVRALSTVTEVRVVLRDHMHDDQINRGVNEHLPFQDVFEDATDDIEAVRRKLDRKARLARQHRAVEHLLDAGMTPEQIAELTSDDFERLDDQIVVYLQDGSVGVPVSADPIRSYLEKAREVGVVTDPDDRLFAGRDGDPIDPDDFESVHRNARLAKTNISGQAGLCAQLHKARDYSRD